MMQWATNSRQPRMPMDERWDSNKIRYENQTTSHATHTTTQPLNSNLHVQSVRNSEKRQIMKYFKRMLVISSTVIHLFTFRSLLQNTNFMTNTNCFVENYTNMIQKSMDNILVAIFLLSEIFSSCSFFPSFVFRSKLAPPTQVVRGLLQKQRRTLDTRSSRRFTFLN